MFLENFWPSTLEFKVGVDYSVKSGRTLTFVGYLNKLPIKMCRPLAKDESHILQVSQQKKLHPNSLHLEDFRLDCKSPKRTKMKN